MKKFLSITTSLCAGLCAAGLGSAAFASADAADTEGYYPSSFETIPNFEELKDYAVGDGEVLFLQDNTIYKFSGENVTPYENSRMTIIALYFESGEFYYRTSDLAVYALENFNEVDKPESDFVSTTETDEITLNGSYYHYDNDVIYVLKNHVDTEIEGFSNLKKFGNTVYAVKENVLYTLNGTDATPVKVQDFNLTNKIKVGGAYEALTADAGDKLKFVRLDNGNYMTEVDLDKLTANSEYFETGDTVKTVTADTPTALLLYKVGDDNEGLSIIAVNGDTYLIHPGSTSDIERYALQDSEYRDGTITTGYVYSVPFDSEATKITPLLSGTTVKILGEVRKETNTELTDDFYFIEYNDGETTVKGYVLFRHMSMFTFNEDPPEITTDPGETFDDLIKPVVLILLVLLLVAIAVGYLVYVGTAEKRKNKTNDSNK